jgi:hypothetical protein
MFGRLVEQPQSPLPQCGRRLVHITHPVRELLQAGTGTLQEPGYRRLRCQRRQQLELSAARGRTPGPQHRLSDPLLGVLLSMQQLEAKRLYLKGDRCVEIGHRQSDMVNGLDEWPKDVTGRGGAHGFQRARLALSSDLWTQGRIAAARFGSSVAPVGEEGSSWDQ